MAALPRPKREPGLPAEYEAIVRRGFSDEEALKWARDDYHRDEMVELPFFGDSIHVMNMDSGYSTAAALVFEQCEELMVDSGNVILEHCNHESNACRDRLEMTTPRNHHL
ncbi:hypothetical protein TRIUR3_13277 [Triticum urartu]|uniref:Uncharacterized protein n=1 Tax=Triticum urartu TaxID=4572 RepID=M8B3Q1_TRIUA|nr:hypothetical protein TRIUR3_13277 [Triticum urartu]